MLIQLAEWRINMLTGLAVVDDRVKAQRESWVRLLRKLEKLIS